MLEPEQEAVATLRQQPWLLGGGLLVGAAWLVAHVVAAVPVMFFTLVRGTQLVYFFPLAGLVSVVVLPPTLAGLYVAARDVRRREDRVGPAGSLRLVLDGCLGHARELWTATLWFRLLALVPAAIALGVLFAGDTVVTYWQYAGGASEPRNGIGELLVAGFYVLVSGVVARLLLAFYDLPVLFAGVSPRRGTRAALRFARRRPGALFRYAIGRSLLFVPMFLVVLWMGSAVSGSIGPDAALLTVAVLLATALVVGTVVSTLLAVYHVVFYERAVEPTLRAPTATSGTTDDPDSLLTAPASMETDGVGLRGLAVGLAAVLLVTAGGVGAGAVRVDDARPSPGPVSHPVDESTDAEEIVRNAQRTLATTSHRSETRVFEGNETTDEHLVLVMSTAVDPGERRIRFSSRDVGDDSPQVWGLYGSDATYALRFPRADSENSSGAVGFRQRFVGRIGGDWSVLYVAGYPELDGSVAQDLDGTAGGGDWRFVERTDEQVVVGHTERPDREPGGTGEVTVERVRLSVDPDTGRPERLVVTEETRIYENGSVVERQHRRSVTNYSELGSTAVERPDDIGPRGPVEWVLDFVYY